MKKILISLAVIFGLVMGLHAQSNPKKMKNFRAVPMQKAQILQEGKAKMYCPVCGMTLPMFYKTNHAAKIDEKTHQYCSIHCMHEHAMMEGKKVNTPQVVDNDTLKFIMSKDAYYVVGSKKPATMAMVSKYAFGTKASAETFAKKFGGEVQRYDAVANEVQKGLKKEINMIKKRQAKAAKMGQKIYMKMCKQTDRRFKNPAQAKAFLKENNICGNLKGKPFQQVGLFLSGK